ncbi:hypothetical protein MRB53_019490 [Persea americana]|uniref:Uncharacterized protein n=1 Tax=Persea americana TaxID=3435 RepID=A0ACC2KYW4_PERAE|nr:hypothetical protein MRB53_019490 [Persea americana]
MSQNWQFQMGADRSNAGQQQLGDTTYTKIFVGGLAWETRRETMRRYFEQFGEILEAVVITDKNTGRSKGYGFVTFKDPDSAMRACQDPSPVIDGRRANCNLASLGARPSRPSTPQHGVGRYRPVVPGSPPALYHGTSTAYFNRNTQYPFPNSAYGYSGYSQENMYPMNYYHVYGGQQFAPYYSAGAGMYHNYYPYYAQFAQSSQSQGFGMQYPQTAQYPYLPQQLGAGVLSLPASVATSTGVVRPPPAVSSSFQGRTLATKEQNPTA